MATIVAPQRGAETKGFEQERPFTPGTVWSVQFFRVKAGFDMEYGRQLAETWRKIMDEQKQQGLVVSYKIFTNMPKDREDFTHMLMIEFPNWAALDQLDKFDAGVRKIHTSLADMAETMRKREEIREAIGSRLVREVHFK